MSDSKPDLHQNKPSDRAEPSNPAPEDLGTPTQVSALPTVEALSPALSRLTQTARDYAAAKSSTNTQRAYASDWALFSRWCRRKGFDAREPSAQVVGLYLAASASGDGIAKAAVSTIERRLAAITTQYRSAGTPLPRQDRHIVDVLAGIKRTHGRPPKQKEALFAEDILAMCATLSQDLRGFRDRAMLLLGFAGGLRRSEITGLDCGPEQTADSGGWLEIVEDGALLTIKGKTGWRMVEVGRGSKDTTCPVHALELWLKLARVSHGPVFRRVREKNTGVGTERLDDKHIARLVQSTALAAGIRGDLPEGQRAGLFAGHSLRAGLASSADVDEAYIQRQLGHASADMTRRYIRQKERFRVNLTKAAGL
jgi:integrase